MYTIMLLLIDIVFAVACAIPYNIYLNANLFGKERSCILNIASPGWWRRTKGVVIFVRPFCHCLGYQYTRSTATLFVYALRSHWTILYYLAICVIHCFVIQHHRQSREAEWCRLIFAPLMQTYPSCGFSPTSESPGNLKKRGQKWICTRLYPSRWCCVSGRLELRPASSSSYKRRTDHPSILL